MHGLVHDVDRRSQTDVNGLRCLFAMFLLAAVGNSVLVVQPLTVGAMVNLLGFSDRQAGLVAFGELGGFSLGSLLMSGMIHKYNRHYIAYSGIALVILGNVLATIPHTFLPFIMMRAIAGFGCAMPIASFQGTAACTRVPDRTFAAVNASTVSYSGILLIVAPSLIDLGGLRLIYLMLAGAAGLYALAVHWIPSRPIVSGPAASSIALRSKVDPRSSGRQTVAFMWILLLAAMLFLYMAHGAIWAYQERIGASMGLDQHSIGTALGVAMIIGISGSATAWLSGVGIGRVWPQIISLGLSMAAAILLISGRSVIAFAAASSLITYSWFYGLPYQFGLLAKVDPKGRANVAGGVMTTGGAALGPAIAAFLISPGHFAIIGWFAAMCYIVCLSFILPPAITIERADKRGVEGRT